MDYFAKFAKPLTNHICAFWRETKRVMKFWENSDFFDENSIEKLNIFIFMIFENLLLKIKP